jgi:hypothetical protein
MKWPLAEEVTREMQPLAIPIPQRYGKVANEPRDCRVAPTFHRPHHDRAVRETLSRGGIDTESRAEALPIVESNVCHERPAAAAANHGPSVVNVFGERPEEAPSKSDGAVGPHRRRIGRIDPLSPQNPLTFFAWIFSGPQGPVTCECRHPELDGLKPLAGKARGMGEPP